MTSIKILYQANYFFKCVKKSWLEKDNVEWVAIGAKAQGKTFYEDFVHARELHPWPLLQPTSSSFMLEY